LSRHIEDVGRPRTDTIYNWMCTFETTPSDSHPARWVDLAGNILHHHRGRRVDLDSLTVASATVGAVPRRKGRPGFGDVDVLPLSECESLWL
jgi:hypothetical protein